MCVCAYVRMCVCACIVCDTPYPMSSQRVVAYERLLSPCMLGDLFYKGGPSRGQEDRRGWVRA